MSRVHTFLTILLVFVVALVIHLIGVALFEPLQTALTSRFDMGVFNGASVMTDIREMLVIWVPVIMVVGIAAWGFMREFRRQRQTAVIGQQPP